MPCCANTSSGALTRLAALGAQDAYTCIAPETTFFRQLYRRHTNFAIAEQCVTFQGSIGFDRCLCTIVPRNGDLIKWMYMVFDLTALHLPLNPESVPPTDPATDFVYWANAIGQLLIQELTFTIGGAQFDRLTNFYLDIWEEASLTVGKAQTEAIGKFDNVEDQRDFAFRDQTLYVYIPLWFSRHYELSLPLIALQYHDVRVCVQTAPRDHCIIAYTAQDVVIPLALVQGGEMTDAHLLFSYVYLDTAERRIMAQQPHEFLFSQLQIQCAESVVAGTTRKTIPVQFNNLLQEVFITYQELFIRNPPINQWMQFGIDAEVPFPWQVGGPLPKVDPIEMIELQLNGHVIYSHDGKYARIIDYYNYHSHITTQFIYSGSVFAIHPEEDVAPSGSLNASRIDNIVYCIEFAKNADGGSALENDGEVTIYARNLNVMKVAGGMAAARFAN